MPQLDTKTFVLRLGPTLVGTKVLKKYIVQKWNQITGGISDMMVPTLVQGGGASTPLAKATMQS